MTQPLRVLQLTEAFGGGVVASVTRLSSGLAARGHEVHLAFARRQETPRDVAALVHPAVRLHELPLVRSISPVSDARGFLLVRRLLRSLDPDVVHLHSSKAGVLGRMAAWSLRRSGRVFYSPRGLAFLQEDYSRHARALFARLEWGMARLGGTVVACSRSEAELLLTRVRAPRVVLIENAVDVAAVPEHRPSDDGLVRIGIAGRITYARNSELFATVARANAAPGVSFRWIGGGSPDDEARLVRAGVEVTGWMHGNDAVRALSELDIYLHLSRWEGMPIALIESQVAGLPAVATDIIGNRDVVTHGETGFLHAQFEDISRSLALLTNDPALRRRMGRRARELALRRFDVARMVDEYEALYRGATEGRSRSAV